MRRVLPPERALVAAGEHGVTTIVTFCLYIAFLRRNRQANTERARSAAFDRMLTDVELRPTSQVRIRQVTLNGDLCDD